TVTVRQDDGTFLSVIASAPEIRFSASTREGAEQGAKKLFLTSRKKAKGNVSTPVIATKLAGLTINIEWDEKSRCYVTYVPFLDNISTFAETYDEALKQTRDLIVGYLKSMRETGRKLPLTNS